MQHLNGRIFLLFLSACNERRSFLSSSGISSILFSLCDILYKKVLSLCIRPGVGNKINKENLQKKKIKSIPLFSLFLSLFIQITVELCTPPLYPYPSFVFNFKFSVQQKAGCKIETILKCTVI